MSSVASVMRMRADVSRAGENDDPYDSATKTLVGNAVPCYVWIEQYRDVIDGQSVTVEKMKAYFRKDADVRRLDTIIQILNRNGDVLYAGPIVIDSIVPKVIGAVVSHMEAVLRRHHGS